MFCYEGAILIFYSLKQKMSNKWETNSIKEKIVEATKRYKPKNNRGAKSMIRALITFKITFQDITTIIQTLLRNVS